MLFFFTIERSSFPPVFIGLIHVESK